MLNIVVSKSSRIEPQISSEVGVAVLILANIRIGEKKGIIDKIIETLLWGFLTINVIIIRGMNRSITKGDEACCAS